MKNAVRNLSTFVILLGLLMSTAVFGQSKNDRDIRDAVRSLISKIEDFEANLRYQMQSASANSEQISEASDHIRRLRTSVRQFQDQYDRKRENRSDVSSVIDAARRVNEFLMDNPQNRRVEDDWEGVKKQIDRLSVNYRITPSWSGSSVGREDEQDPWPSGSRSAGLSGTYDLDAARSENVDDIVAEAKLGAEHRTDLKDKLAAPNQVALDVRGNQVTLATTNAAPVTFVADGRETSEPSASGKTVRLRATLATNRLVVSSLGGETDYTITFESEDDGRVLKVSRRITTEYLDQTVFAESIYNKTDSVARLGIKQDRTTGDSSGGYSDNDTSAAVSNGGSGSGYPQSRTGVPSAVTSRPGNYIVPNGVAITGVLENELNTKVSQNNDRFRMTVQSPNEFRGAVIEGYVSGLSRSGAVSGDPKMTLSFEKITLSDGTVFDFAGNLQSVQAVNGKKVSVDNEGTVRGESQTKNTAKRGGIGAGIGAVIGAIAGGAKGAAIGAVIGAGGGAGTVAVQGKTDIQLQQGSTITVVSSSPMR